MKNKKQVQHMLNRYEEEEPFVLALEWVLEITSEEAVHIQMDDRQWKAVGRNRPDNE